MEKVVYNPIMDKNYIGIVTVLDYETSVRNCLSSVLVGTQNRMERKVIKHTHVMQGTSGSHNGKADGYYDTNGNSYSSGECKFVAKNEGIVFA